VVRRSGAADRARLKTVERGRPASAAASAIDRGQPALAARRNTGHDGAVGRRRRRRPQENTMYKRILVPTDGSEISNKAVQTAISVARMTGAQLMTISIKEPFPYSAISEMQPVPPQEFYDAQERIAAARVKEATDAAQAAGVSCQGYTVEAMHPYEAILDHAKNQGCDLIVMASHGRRGLSALLLGSETQKVLTHSPIPVLVVK
jgi:nucleotide-binding universal stress UspA family protein